MSNRTIKFRGMRKDNNEWVYGDLFTSHSEHHSPNVSIATDEFHPVGYGSKTFHEVKPETVGQFTGLTDKNGKEVYEGDIGFMENFGTSIFIEWHQGSLGYYTSKDTRYSSFRPIASHNNISIVDNCLVDFEITGNIHENQLTSTPGVNRAVKL